MTERQLLDLKNKIAEAKQTTAEMKGHQNALMKQLKDDWGCKDLKEAETLIAKMDAEIGLLRTDVERSLKELEEKYNG